MPVSSESLPRPPAAGSGPPPEQLFEGVGVAPGVAIGPVLRYASPSFEAPPERVEAAEAAAEVARFERALELAGRELRKVAALARQKLGEASAEIFEAQILLLRDPALYDDARALIREERYSADFAAQTVLGRLRRQIEDSQNEYLRERATDLLDLQNRLLRNLQQSRAFSGIEPDRLVVAESLTAADLLLFSRRNVLGCATDYGGPTSHVSIMARALGIPAVVSLHGLSEQVEGGETAVIDGFTGRVILHPSKATLAEYRARVAAYARGVEARRELAPLPAETLDGHRLALRANIDLEEEHELLGRHGAEGIGLYRTEMLLIARGRPLEEEEQLEAYRAALRAARPHPVTFRLLDLGGDKFLPMAQREHNPFLGWRGVRILLDRPELVRPQLRAVLRAAAEGPARILVPMVTEAEEVRRVRALLEQAAEELRREGLDHDPNVPLGVMVEVPAVALSIRRFVPVSDFFSIGTNDLTQFLMAVDRGNDLVADRYREFHPALLALIRQVADAGQRHGLPVGLCGEMAGNPRAAALLVGLGVGELSASPAQLLLLKQVIRSTSLEEARALARRALAQPDAQSVVTLLETWLREHQPELAAYFDGASSS